MKQYTYGKTNQGVNNMITYLTLVYDVDKQIRIKFFDTLKECSDYLRANFKDIIIGRTYDIYDDDQARRLIDQFVKNVENPKDIALSAIHNEVIDE